MKIGKNAFKKIIDLITDSDRLISVVTDIKGYVNWCKSEKLKTIGFEFDRGIVARAFRLKVKKVLLEGGVENVNAIYLRVERKTLYLSVRGVL